MANKLHRNALRPGYELLWYRIDRILGQGGFGITYLAHDTNLDQAVAIKEYLPIELAVREGDFSVHPVSEDHDGNYRWGLSRFITEAQTLAKFDHPNIVRVLSVFEANNTAYMVMRYEKGQSLQEMLPRGKTLEEVQLMNILFPVLGGLREIHAAGFIHRDIKPGNIFIREDGSPVLIDFGSARQALGQETKTLTTLVSPGYAPFEQYYSKSDKQGPWTDIYSLGATLYRAAVGVAPADAVDRSEGLLNQSSDAHRPAAEAAANRYSERFLAAVDHALCFREEERPRSVDEWLQAFSLPDAPTEVAGTRVEAATPETKQIPSRIARADGATPVGGPTVVRGAPVHTGAGRESPTEARPAERGEVSFLERFIGSQNTDYYLARFDSFQKRRGGWPISWHWAGAFFTFFWMLYRRLYLWAFLAYPFLTVLLTVVVLIPVSVLGFGGGDIPGAISGPVLILVSILWPGIFASAIYYRRAKSSIARMEKKNLDVQARRRWLERRGGVSRLALGAGIAGAALFWLLVAADQANKRSQEAGAGRQTEQLPNQQQPEEPGARIERLLEQAAEDYEALRLTTPPGENALEKLREILALDPENESAKQGLRLIVEKYMELAENAASGGEPDKAGRYIGRALEIAPRAQELRKAAVEFYVEQGKRAWQQGEFDAAEGYLDRAAEIAPRPQAIKRLKKRLEQARRRR